MKLSSERDTLLKSMNLKRTLIEVFNTREAYNNSDETGSGSSILWRIFIILIIILFIIISFICCYRYVYLKIIHTFQRCLKRRLRGGNADDDFPIVKACETETYERRRFLWVSSLRKFWTRPSIQNNKQSNDKCKLETLSQEKKKLLGPSESKIPPNVNNLTERLSMKMSLATLALRDSKTKGIRSQNYKWDVKNPTNCRSNQSNAHSIENINNVSRKEMDICFSDTDVKFLVIPMSSRKSGTMKQDGMVLCKWNSGNIDEYYERRNNTSSKLIELKYNNIKSLSNLMENFEMPTITTNNSPDSIASESLIKNSTYFSNTVSNRSNILPDVSLERLQRSSNSHIDFTLTDNSSLDKTNTGSVQRIPEEETCPQLLIEKVENRIAYTTEENATNKVNELREIKSGMKRKMKSSIDVHLNYIKENHSHNFESMKPQIREVRSFGQVSKSDGNFVNEFASSKMNYNNIKNRVIAEKNLSSVCNRSDYETEGNPLRLNDDTETNEIYDELGILFSRQLKLQARPCRRKYCSLSRLLKQRPLHSGQKCQGRFQYYRMYPYDQRPACNSGNVCRDTYDELKLTCTSPSERKNIYQDMFKRRKQFLNEPCTLPN